MVAGKYKKYLGLFAGVSAGFKWNGPGQSGAEQRVDFRDLRPVSKERKAKEKTPGAWLGIPCEFLLLS